jgi:hypothetical protein
VLCSRVWPGTTHLTSAHEGETVEARIETISAFLAVVEAENALLTTACSRPPISFAARAWLGSVAKMARVAAIRARKARHITARRARSGLQIIGRG